MTKQLGSGRIVPGIAVLVALFIATTGCGKKESNPSLQQAETAPTMEPTVSTAAGMPGMPQIIDGKPVGSFDPPAGIVPIPKKPPVLIAECHFVREDQDKKGVHKTSCIASAKVCFEGFEKSYDDKTPCYCKNKLVVACNGKQIYDDEPTHTQMNGYEYLVGSSDPSDLVILQFPSTSPGEYNPHQKSYLNIKNYQFEGKCELHWTDDLY